MMDLSTLVKDYVSSIVKSKTIPIEVGLYYDKLIVCVDGAYLYSMQIENTGVSFGIMYNQFIKANTDKDPDSKKTIITAPVELFVNYDILNKLLGLEAKYLNITNSLIPSAEVADFRELDELYNTIYSLKAEDGVRFIQINGKDLYHRYIYPIFTGNPNLNKNDGLSLQIFDESRDTYIIKSCIYKKKINKYITCFSRHLNMDMPLFDPYR